MSELIRSVLQPCIDVKMYGLMKILNGSDIQMEPKLSSFNSKMDDY